MAQQAVCKNGVRGLHAVADQEVGWVWNSGQMSLVQQYLVSEDEENGTLWNWVFPSLGDENFVEEAFLHATWICRKPE